MSKIHLNCIDFSTIKTKVVIFDHFYICFNYSENTIKHEHKKKSTVFRKRHIFSMISVFRFQFSVSQK